MFLFDMLKVLRYIALNACVKYCTKDQSNVEEVEAITDSIEFTLFHVEDIKCHGMTQLVKVHRKDQSVKISLQNGYFYYFGQFRVIL